MSTILDALRKARTEPGRGAMEAREEILRAQSHDYLATVPGKPHDEVRTLRRLVYFSAGVILLLVLVLLALMVRQQGKASLAAPEAVETGAAQADADRPDLSPPATAETRVEITVATPAVQPAESPMVAPIETPLPASETNAAATGDEDIIAKADALRSEKIRAPRAAEVETSSGSFSTANIRIGGIVWDKTSPVAMVDGKVVKPGSMVHGARVVKINRDSVVFEVAGKQYTARQ